MKQTSKKCFFDFFESASLTGALHQSRASPQTGALQQTRALPQNWHFSIIVDTRIKADDFFMTQTGAFHQTPLNSPMKMVTFLGSS